MTLKKLARGEAAGGSCSVKVGRHLTFQDPALEAAYLNYANSLQAPLDEALLLVDVLLQLVMAAALSKAGAGLVAWLPVLFILADFGRIWLSAFRRATYVRHREWLLGLAQPLYFIEAYIAQAHGIYVGGCRNALAFWLAHLLSTSAVYLVLAPLGMPLRYRTLMLTCTASLAPILLSDSVRCNNSAARCPRGAAWFEQATALLAAIAGLAGPMAWAPLRGKAACVAVHVQTQVMVWFAMLAGPIFCMERRRRARFAQQVGRPELRKAVLRPRRKPALVAANMALLFVAAWHLQSLVLSDMFPSGLHDTWQ